MSELGIESLFVKHFSYADPASCSLCRICWTNAFASCADIRLAKLYLFESVYSCVKIKIDVTSVTDENAIVDIDAMLLDCIHLFEKARHVNNTTRTDEIDATVRENTRSCVSRQHFSCTLPSAALTQNVYVKGNSILHYRVSCIMPTLSSTAKLHSIAENVHNLALAFVTPLSAKDDGCHV